MKQKLPQDRPLTKRDLLEILQIYSTKTDEKIESLSAKTDAKIKSLSVKTDEKIESLREEMKREFSAMETRLDIKLEKMELRIDDRARMYNSKILTKFDQWANDFKAAQTERVVTASQLTTLRTDVDTLKKRVTKLENN